MATIEVAGARLRRLAPCALAAIAMLAPATLCAWELARIEPRVDNLDELLCACQEKQAKVLDRNREIDVWTAYQAEQGEAASGELRKSPVPVCSGEEIGARLALARPGVWAIAAGSGVLFATVNLPVPAVMVSSDGGHSWHYRHLFLRGYNIERGLLLRGIDYRDGLLAVASEGGVLLSTDGGHTFITALGEHPFSAVAISPVSKQVLVAGGNATSFLSTDGGASWTNLHFSQFTATLATHNPYLIDHITSMQFDPATPDTVYVGTGSHLYRLVMDAARAGGRWQAMEGGAGGRVLDDSTVYNIEIGTRFMISTCNGVYFMQRLGTDLSRDQADVSWGKFRDSLFTKRGVGGPKGNLRAYYVSEDPADRARILVADFAGLYEGRSDRGAVHWRRVDDLPYYSETAGYPEYTAIAWTTKGEAVVGSRYQGIFVQAATVPTTAATAAAPAPAKPPASRSAGCVLR
jgi:hypothetical protein